MSEVVQLNRRFLAAIVSLGAIVLFDLLALPVGWWHLEYLKSLPPAAIVAEQEPVLADLAQLLISLVRLVALVVTAICFILWFRLVYLNVAQFTGRDTNHDVRWTFWGFAVPFLNLIRPQQLMREIWDGTCAYWLEYRPAGDQSQPTADLVNLWWGTFVVSCLLGNVAGRLSWRAERAADMVTAARLLLVSDGFDVIAGAIAIVLVLNVTALQRRVLELRATSGSHVGPG